MVNITLFAVVVLDSDAEAAVALGPELALTVGSLMEDVTAAEMSKNHLEIYNTCSGTLLITITRVVDTHPT